MSSNRTERLLNLVICLLATNRWLTKEQIRRAVPQYEDCETPEAFDRMFERDKEDLRELGVPLVTGSNSAWFDDDQGYRIDRDAYPLPEVEFTAEELAVLGLASRVWQQASLAGPAARAMVKLRALGVQTDEGSLVGVEPRVRAAEPSFEPLYAATRDRAPVAFRYRKPEGDVAERRVEPWALASRGGRWYLVGHDLARDARRAFRLSRIEGGVRRIGAAGSVEVPDDVDPKALIGGYAEPPHQEIAALRVRHERGASLRLRALAVTPVPDSEWDLLETTFADTESFAEHVAGFGPDVVVSAPPALREAVVRRLRAAAVVHSGPAKAAKAKASRAAKAAKAVEATTATATTATATATTATMATEARPEAVPR